jgi:hypothetical protein
MLNPEVTALLGKPKHPLIAEINLLRAEILAVDARLTESIKWNGPNYCVDGEDRITMRVQPPKQVQLIFHRGAKVLAQPVARLISNDSKLLDWKANDRAVITFKNMQDIVSAKAALQNIVRAWLKAAGK